VNDLALELRTPVALGVVEVSAVRRVLAAIGVDLVGGRDHVVQVGLFIRLRHAWPYPARWRTDRPRTAIDGDV
jgi:hypothetical protein